MRKTAESVCESLCPHCLRRVSAQRITEGNDVYLHRTCPEHGDIEKVLIWRNDRVPFGVWTKPRAGTCCSSSCNCSETPASARDAAFNTDCPYDCGICPGHRQRTCSAIIEVTARCNLRCPVCFADVPEKCAPDPDIDQIERILANVRQNAGCCPIQLSGGEPTLRNDLPEIISRARALGFDHIQVNTNGLRIAEDPSYAKALREAGVTDFFLQFDGVDDDVYRKIRGRGLLSVKEAAVQAAAELRVAVILVPTLVKGVNDGQIGAILEFAKRRMPAVKGVHFQPMTYLGRYPRTPRNEDRILVPDILAAVEAQTGGELMMENFIPAACEDPRCSFSALAVLGEDGRLVPATHIGMVSARGADAAEKSIAYIRRHWQYPAAALAEPLRSGRRSAVGGRQENSSSRTTASPQADIDPAIERIRNYSLCISGMAFQDVWNIELDRLQRCCVHVAADDYKLVPFCAHYLTAARDLEAQAYRLQEICKPGIRKHEF
ncbi:MAG: radical SAM protein [Acidobacteria bacterium]|nr:radical SAM protein [Acidobacteriota bacterium]